MSFIRRFASGTFLPSVFRSLTPFSENSVADTESTAGDDLPLLVQWENRFLKAFEEDEDGFRSRIRLAEELVRVDKEDIDLVNSGLYRRTIDNYGGKELERITAVLHLLTDEVILALIARDYNSLLAQLPDDLPEQLPALPLWGAIPPKKEAREPIVYMHFHVDDTGVAPTPEEYHKIGDGKSSPLSTRVECR